MKANEPRQSWFERFATRATKATGSNTAFILACIVIIGWIITGPIFHYSDTWQLVINTSTTIITFLMVFLIQKTQNKDALAIQIKLNELVAASQKASNRIVSVEDLSEKELEKLNKDYTKLAKMTQREKNLQASRSIDEIMNRKPQNQPTHIPKLKEEKKEFKKPDQPAERKAENPSEQRQSRFQKRKKPEE